LDRDKVEPKEKQYGLSMMFWAAFCWVYQSALVPLLGDPESARGGVTARVILDCLIENLPTIAEPGRVFMQDNARTHTARIVQNWLCPWAEENGVSLLDWPPYSPDLNPIENLWKLLKERIIHNHPELSSMPKNDKTLQRLCEAAVEAWHEMDEEILDNLVSSMKNRLEAVIKADGWYTKY
jgi:transposase